MAEAASPRFIKTTVSHTDYINSSIQKRINGVARAIEKRFRKMIKALEEENDTLKSRVVFLESFLKNSKPSTTENPGITSKPAIIELAAKPVIVEQREREQRERQQREREREQREREQHEQREREQREREQREREQCEREQRERDQREREQRECEQSEFLRDLREFYKFDEQHRDLLEQNDILLIETNIDNMEWDALFANQKEMQRSYPEPQPINHYDLCDSAEPVMQRKPTKKKPKNHRRHQRK